jgi:hypothetical protein
MTLHQSLAAYCRSIRNAAKREYAAAYIAHQMADAADAPPEYRCSSMAAQAVRMHVNALLGRRS